MATEPVDVLCSAPEFRALRCAYTGEPLEVYMLVRPGSQPLYHAPRAYSPSVPFPTAEQAYRAWNRVDGVEGVKTGTPIVCAYTGKVLAAAKTSDGHFFRGGFDPRMFHSRDDFLRLATSRGGESARPSGGRVEAVRGGSRPSRARPSAPSGPSDEAVDIAASVLQRHRDDLPAQASSTVSMSVPGGRGAKRGGKGRSR